MEKGRRAHGGSPSLLRAITLCFLILENWMHCTDCSEAPHEQSSLSQSLHRESRDYTPAQGGSEVSEDTVSFESVTSSSPACRMEFNHVR